MQRLQKSITALLLAFSFFSTSLSAEPISFESNNTPIGDFVSWFGGHTGQTIVLGQGVTGSVSFSAVDLKPSEYAAFFDSVLNSHGYQLEKRNGFYTVAVNSEHIEAVEPASVKLYRLQHVRNTKIVQLMASMLSATQVQSLKGNELKNHDVQVLPTTNAIIVTGSDVQLQKIDEIINGIDKPQRQVFIESIITESEIGDSEDIGVNMSLELGNAGFVTNTTAIDKGKDNLLIFDGGNFSAFVKAVSKNEKTKLLSRPNILIMDREDGYITVGQNVPFLVSKEVTDGGKEIQQIERKDVGVSLRVTPHIMGEYVILEIDQESSSVSKSTVASDIITNKRTLKTVVKVKHGQTISLGGLISTEERESESGVPVLMDIPILGWFFSSSKTEDVEKELSVVIRTSVI